MASLQSTPGEPSDSGANQAQLDEHVKLAYEQLRRLAHRVRNPMVGRGCQTTSLVHEVYLRLSRNESLQFRDRGHFLRVAAIAMRRFLTDCARAATAQKRGGRRRDLPLSDGVALTTGMRVDLLDLDEALGRLGRLDPRKNDVITLRFFGGCSLAQTAEALGVSMATVTREWDLAKAWIYHEMNGDGPGGD